jgi:tetratricopeptide (TPR) repeat protein
VASAGAAAPSRSREEVEREDGNAHYKKGHFGEAVKCYTRCIAINPRNVPALSNRAMTYLKLKEWKKAVQDCDLALRTDSTHVKSYTRKATALNGLGRHSAALDNFLTASSLQETKQIVADIRKTREMVKSSIRRTPRTPVEVRILAPGENARVQMSGPLGPGMVEAAEKAYSAHAKAKVREDALAAKKAEAATKEAEKKAAKEAARVWDDRPVPNEELAIKTAELKRASTTAEPPPGSPPVQPNLTPAEMVSASESPKGKSGSKSSGGKARIVIEEASDSDSDIDDIDLKEDELMRELPVEGADRFLNVKSTTVKPAAAPPVPSQVPVAHDADASSGSASNGSTDKSSSISSSSSSSSAAEARKKKTKKKGEAKEAKKSKGKKSGGKAPKTSYEFMRKWRELDASGRFEFLRAIKPSAIAKLFKSNLDGEQLIGVLHTVRNFYFP